MNSVAATGTVKRFSADNVRRKGTFKSMDGGAPPPLHLQSHAEFPIYSESSGYHPVTDSRRASAGTPLNHQSLPPYTTNKYVIYRYELQAYCAQQQQPASRTTTPINTMNGYELPPKSLPPLKMSTIYQRGMEPIYETHSYQVMPSSASCIYSPTLPTFRQAQIQRQHARGNETTVKFSAKPIWTSHYTLADALVVLTKAETVSKSRRTLAN